MNKINETETETINKSNKTIVVTPQENCFQDYRFLPALFCTSTVHPLTYTVDEHPESHTHKVGVTTILPQHAVPLICKACINYCALSYYRQS